MKPRARVRLNKHGMIDVTTGKVVVASPFGAASQTTHYEKWLKDAKKRVKGTGANVFRKPKEVDPQKRRAFLDSQNARQSKEREELLNIAPMKHPLDANIMKVFMAAPEEGGIKFHSLNALRREFMQRMHAPTWIVELRIQCLAKAGKFGKTIVGLNTKNKTKKNSTAKPAAQKKIAVNVLTPPFERQSALRQILKMNDNKSLMVLFETACRKEKGIAVPFDQKIIVTTNELRWVVDNHATPFARTALFERMKSAETRITAEAKQLKSKAA